MRQLVVIAVAAAASKLQQHEKQNSGCAHPIPDEHGIWLRRKSKQHFEACLPKG